MNSSSFGIVYPENWQHLCEATNIICKPEDEVAGNTHQLEETISQALLQTLACLPAKRLGLALSGGLDSSVLAKMLKTLGVSFTAITIADSYDHPDVLHSQLVVRQIHINHIVHILDKNDRPREKYDLLFQAARVYKLTGMICGDTIDEQLGGYYYHLYPEHFDQAPGSPAEDKIRSVYNDYWRKLSLNHLQPLNEFSAKHNVQTALPYLGILPFTRYLPLRQRSYNRCGKIILRELGLRLGLPNEVLTRKKLGLCDVIK